MLPRGQDESRDLIDFTAERTSPSTARQGENKIKHWLHGRLHPFWMATSHDRRKKFTERVMAPCDWCVHEAMTVLLLAVPGNALLHIQGFVHRDGAPAGEDRAALGERGCVLE